MRGKVFEELTDAVAEEIRKLWKQRNKKRTR